MTIKIIDFEDQYASHFGQLNFEWLEKYFYVEEYDKKVLNNPKEYILDKNGYIFFALREDEVVGTVALIDRNDEGYELSKMGVTEKYQGLKIGEKLLQHALDFSWSKGLNRVFLDSNRKLKPALHLYEKLGFTEIPVPKDTPYERCDIRMEIFNKKDLKV